MFSPAPSAAVRSGTAPRYPGGYWRELAETLGRDGGGGGAAVAGAGADACADGMSRGASDGDASAVCLDRAALTSGLRGRPWAGAERVRGGPAAAAAGRRQRKRGGHGGANWRASIVEKKWNVCGWQVLIGKKEREREGGREGSNEVIE